MPRKTERGFRFGAIERDLMQFRTGNLEDEIVEGGEL
jgi:hypothetical protein